MRDFYALGIDPDTKTTGLGLVACYPDRTTRPVYAACAKAKGRYAKDRMAGMATALLDTMAEIADYTEPGFSSDDSMEPDLIVVEWMKLRPTGEKNPNAILDLQGVAGMAITAALQWFPQTPVILYTPGDWTKGVAKDKRHRRLERRWETQLANVDGLDTILKGQISHVYDGLDLAKFGLLDQRVRRKHLTGS